MVLLYGIPGDGPFELIADALEEIRAPIVLLDQRRFAETDFILQINNEGYEGEISIGHLSYPLSGFTGVYNRGVDFSMLLENSKTDIDPLSCQRYTALFEMLHAWMESTTCAVVNKTSAMSSNASKPYQLKLIQPFFAVPDTVITNSVADVRAFESLSTGIIYKSASSVRSIVKTTTTKDNPALQSIHHCPTLFQQKLEGVNYRVHVVGEEVFAVKAVTGTVDYRYSHREGKETVLIPVELDKDIHEKCIALAKRLSLPFAGIDLFQTTENRWFCFEVNPSPGFSYFESATGQPIAAAVARYLLSSTTS
jgi:hypothetical protein